MRKAIIFSFLLLICCVFATISSYAAAGDFEPTVQIDFENIATVNDIQNDQNLSDTIYSYGNLSLSTDVPEVNNTSIGNISLMTHGLNENWIQLMNTYNLRTIELWFKTNVSEDPRTTLQVPNLPLVSSGKYEYDCDPNLCVNYWGHWGTALSGTNFTGSQYEKQGSFGIKAGYGDIFGPDVATTGQDYFRNNRWHHVTFVLNRTQASVFVNSSLLDTNADVHGQILSGNNTIEIGKQDRSTDIYPSAHSYLLGPSNIDEIKMYRCSATELGAKQAFENGSISPDGLTCPPIITNITHINSSHDVDIQSTCYDPDNHSIDITCNLYRNGSSYSSNTVENVTQNLSTEVCQINEEDRNSNDSWRVEIKCTDGNMSYQKKNYTLSVSNTTQDTDSPSGGGGGSGSAWPDEEINDTPEKNETVQPEIPEFGPFEQFGKIFSQIIQEGLTKENRKQLGLWSREYWYIPLLFVALVAVVIYVAYESQKGKKKRSKR